MSTRGRVKRPSFLRRTFVFILAMLLGMAVLVGAVAGGIYAALALVSLDTLEGVGIGVADGLLTEDSLLRELSVLGIIGELASVSGRLSSFTINTLTAEYGVILTEEIRALIPAALFDVPLSELTGPNALGVILQNVTVGDVWGAGGEQSLPPRAWEKLAPRPLIYAATGELYLLFDGLYLGDFTGVPLTVAPDGTAEPDFSAGAVESLASYLGTVNLGEYFSLQDGTPVIQASLDRTPLESFIEGAEGNPVAGALKNKMLGDLLKIQEGGITFSADSLTDGLYLGDVISYTKGEDGIWYDANDKAATGVFRELAGLPVSNLSGDKIMEAIDSVYFAEMMDYERREIGTDENGKPKYVFEKVENGVTKTPDGMIAEFAEMTIGQLRTDGELDKTVKEMQIGVAMGFTLKDGVWYDGNDPATGAFRPFLGKTIGSLNSELNTIYLGEIMGFDPLYEGGSETPTAFYKDENANGIYDEGVDTKPGALMGAFVDMTLEEIENEQAFSDRVQTIRIGDAMGYTLDGEVWEHEDGTPVTGMFRTLAGKRVDELEEAVKEVSVADALGYEYTDGKWVSTDGKNTEPPGILRVLMTSTLTSLPGDAGNVYVGEIMGYEKYDRDPDPDKEDIGFRRPNPDKKEDSDPDYLYPTGAVAEFADMKVSQLEREGEITKKIDGMTVGTAMGYTYDATNGHWLDKENHEVTNNLLKAVIDKKVGEMGGVLNEMTLGEAMGYTFVACPEDCTKGDDCSDHNIWYVVYNNPENSEKPNEKVDNAFILSIIDEKVGDLGTVMDDLTVGEAMGYTYSGTCSEEDCEWEGDRCEHVTWKDPDGGEVSGYVKIIGPETRLKDLKRTLSDLDNVTIGELEGAGLLDLSDHGDKLEYIFGEGESWKELSINDFIDEMLNKVPGP